jgi:hypothetical protein
MFQFSRTQHTQETAMSQQQTPSVAYSASGLGYLAGEQETDMGLFTQDAKSKGTFVAEASDLGWRPGAVANSLKVAGHVFALTRVQRDREGDLQFVEYTSINVPLKFVVFND